MRWFAWAPLLIDVARSLPGIGITTLAWRLQDVIVAAGRVTGRKVGRSGVRILRAGSRAGRDGRGGRVQVVTGCGSWATRRTSPPDWRPRYCPPSPSTPSEKSAVLLVPSEI